MSLAPPASPLHLVILAGGAGTRARRADASAPKQFRRIVGQSLYLHSARELVRAPGVSTLTVVVPEPWLPQARAELAAAEIPCPWLLAPGGETRTASTWSALVALAEAHAPAPEHLVAVHDAARPFATRHLLLRVAAAASARGAAVPGIPPADTIVELDDRGGDAAQWPALARYLERAGLRALQTPQVFRWRPLHAAHQWCHNQGLDFTDDGGLLAARGMTPAIVDGEEANWKVTTEADLARAEAAIRAAGGAGHD